MFPSVVMRYQLEIQFRYKKFEISSAVKWSRGEDPSRFRTKVIFPWIWMNRFRRSIRQKFASRRKLKEEIFHSFTMWTVIDARNWTWLSNLFKLHSFKFSVNAPFTNELTRMFNPILVLMHTNSLEERVIPRLWKVWLFLERGDRNNLSSFIRRIETRLVITPIR